MPKQRVVSEIYAIKNVILEAIQNANITSTEISDNGYPPAPIQICIGHVGSCIGHVGMHIYDVDAF